MINTAVFPGLCLICVGIYMKESLPYLQNPRHDLHTLQLAANPTNNSQQYSRLVRPEQRVVVLVRDSVGRLIAIDVVAPPGATSPPEGAQPDIRV
jgi:hypothetical protein